jgi:hypothetical protein
LTATSSDDIYKCLALFITGVAFMVAKGAKMGDKSVDEVVELEVKRLGLAKGTGPTSEQRQEIMAAVKKARPHMKVTSIKSQAGNALKDMGHRSRRSKSAGAAESNGAAGADAALFALKAGGTIEKARALLDKVESDPAMEFAIACGGIDAARRALKDLEKRL